MKLKNLKVPVNPTYDFDRDPTEQTAEYVNPVTLAYKQIYYANYAAEVTVNLNRINQDVAETKVLLQRAKYALEDLESELLGQFPAPAADRKTNKLLEAYIRRVAHDAGRADEYRQRVQAVRDADETLERLQAQAENGRQAHNLIKLLGDQARTYLSFHKHEENITR